MTAEAPRVVGILAGGGSLPREIAERVAARGDRVHIVALAGAGGSDFAPYPTTAIGFGQIGAMLDAFRGAGCTELVIVGSARRPDLASVRPDWGLFRNLPAILRIIAAGGDDSVLSRIVRFFEAQGFRVVGPATLAPELLVGEGPLGVRAAPAGVGEDIALGFELVRRLGPFDVGQAVVATGGRIEAVEGAEGTDAMLARVARLRRARSDAGPAGVLVKRPKPAQDLRVDLPAIGPDTVRRAVEAGLAGIAVLAGGVLAAERAELARLADAAGLFVVGFAAPEAPVGDQAYEGEPPWLVTLGRRSLRRRQREDVLKGADAMTAMLPPLKSRGAVVDRGHILAIESGEGAADLIARASSLRQWGMWRLRRSAVAVLSDRADLGTALSGAAATGLAGLALLGEPPAITAAATRAAIRDADRLGLFLAVLAPGGRTP